jgi:hypothetical protein
LSRVFSFTIFLVAIIWSVNALFLQAEMAILDSTPLPNLAVKLVLALLVLAGGMSQLVSGRAVAAPRLVFRFWLAFTVYLMIEAGILLLRFNYPVEYLLFSYNVYYYAVLFLPFLFYLRQTLDEWLVARTLVVFFVPLSLIGIVQNLSGTALLPTVSPNGYLEVMSWGFYGAVRGFSLFGSALDFGHFIALMGSLGLAFVLARRGKAKTGCLVLLLALSAGYCTLTRTTYLEIACAMFTVWLLYRRPRYRRLVVILPLLYGLLGAVVAFVVPFWTGRVSADNLLSNESLLERYAEWTYYGALWLGTNLSNMLFGTGMVQNDRFEVSANVLVDNTFLAVGLHIGAIGLLLWFGITWCIWKHMLAVCQESLSPVRAAAAGAWSVWLFTSVFSINVFYLLASMLLLVTRVKQREQDVGAPSGSTACSPTASALPSWQKLARSPA